MSAYQVRLIPDGDYQKVEADDAKEAAEKHYGSALSTIGSNDQLRVMVHPMTWPRGNPILFYGR